MQISFRADASPIIGSGHLMRCLALADELQLNGSTCTFHTLNCPPALKTLLSSHGHAVISIDPRACDEASDAIAVSRACAELAPDWMVVDHYRLGTKWETAVRQHANAILAIDDLADRNHNCDLLLDQNIGRTPEDYRTRIPSNCRVLTGTKFALLRRDFASTRRQKKINVIPASPAHLLVTMGGMDNENITEHVLEALKNSQLPQTTKVSIVMGKDAIWRDKILVMAEKLPWPTKVLHGVTNMAALMATCDLAVTAAGTTVWELCCLGIPMVAVITAENQHRSAAALASSGAALLIDDAKSIHNSLPLEINSLLSFSRRSALSDCAANLVDGTGCERAVAEMMHDK
jgi:UDP-2,4-diacetamido-2,4,6-trideoxy-beta-L-altropyranose hydrolase